MTYGHLQADCLYTGISSGPNARCRVWEAFTFTFNAVFSGEPVEQMPNRHTTAPHVLVLAKKYPMMPLLLIVMIVIMRMMMTELLLSLTCIG